jgi:serine/threonine protein kinase
LTLDDRGEMSLFTPRKKGATRRGSAAYLYRGGFGCTYHPAIKCESYPINGLNLNDYVSKLLTKKHAEDELKVASLISKLDPDNSFSIYPEFLCNPSRSNLRIADNSNYKEQLKQCLKKNTPNTRTPLRNTTPEDGALLYLKYGGTDTLQFFTVKKYAFSDILPIFNGITRLIEGLVFLHENDFIHNDLKSDNIVLKPIPGNKVTLAFIDFGLSLHVSKWFERKENERYQSNLPLEHALLTNYILQWTKNGHTSIETIKNYIDEIQLRITKYMIDNKTNFPNEEFWDTRGLSPYVVDSTINSRIKDKVKYVYDTYWKQKDILDWIQQNSFVFNEAMQRKVPSFEIKKGTAIYDFCASILKYTDLFGFYSMLEHCLNNSLVSYKEKVEGGNYGNYTLNPESAKINNKDCSSLSASQQGVAKSISDIWSTQQYILKSICKDFSKNKTTRDLLATWKKLVEDLTPHLSNPEFQPVFEFAHGEHPSLFEALPSLEPTPKRSWFSWRGGRRRSRTRRRNRLRI